MDSFYGIALIPVVVAAIGAVGFWLFLSRREGVPRSTARTTTAVGSAFALVVAIGYLLFGAEPFWLNSTTIDALSTVLDLRFMFPLVLGIVVLVVLAFPARRQGTVGPAELSRRTPLSFARPWWLIVLGVLLLVALGLALAAGFASRPDDQGHYTMFRVELGTASAGTTIYGWFYSVPCLILLAVTVAVMAADLAVISRPALALDRNKDIAVRRVRALNVVRVGTGAVLMHLSAVLGSLAGTSSLYATFGQTGTSTLGEVSVGTSFAALTTSLQVGSWVAMVLGFAFWFSTLLSVIPTPLRTRRRADFA